MSLGDNDRRHHHFGICCSDDGSWLRRLTASPLLSLVLQFLSRYSDACAHLHMNIDSVIDSKIEAVRAMALVFTPPPTSEEPQQQAPLFSRDFPVRSSSSAPQLQSERGQDSTGFHRARCSTGEHPAAAGGGQDALIAGGRGQRLRSLCSTLGRAAPKHGKKNKILCGALSLRRPTRITSWRPLARRTSPCSMLCSQRTARRAACRRRLCLSRRQQWTGPAPGPVMRCSTTKQSQPRTLY